MRKAFAVLMLAVLAFALVALPVAAFAVEPTATAPPGGVIVRAGGVLGTLPPELAETISLVGTLGFVLMAVDRLGKWGLAGSRKTAAALAIGLGAQAVYYTMTMDAFDWRLLVGRLCLGLLYGGTAAGLWVLRQGPELTAIAGIADFREIKQE